MLPGTSANLFAVVRERKKHRRLAASEEATCRGDDQSNWRIQNMGLDTFGWIWWFRTAWAAWECCWMPNNHSANENTAPKTNCTLLGGGGGGGGGEDDIPDKF